MNLNYCCSSPHWKAINSNFALLIITQLLSRAPISVWRSFINMTKMHGLNVGPRYISTLMTELPVVPLLIFTVVLRPRYMICTILMQPGPTPFHLYCIQHNLTWILNHKLSPIPQTPHGFTSLLPSAFLLPIPHFHHMDHHVDPSTMRYPDTVTFSKSNCRCQHN